ncbi:hypothetical protein Dimus_023523 [Dionaea muscipula]
MASISKEKLQKMKLQGTNNCYVYNYFGMGGSRTPEHHDKRIISKSKGYWGALWKSSNAGKEILDGNKGKSLLSSTHSMESNANVGIRKSVEEEEEEVVERRKLTVPLHPHPHDVGSGYEGEFHVEMGRESSVGHGKIKEAASLAYEAVELNQVKVLVTDMPGFMQVHAVRFARLTYDSMDKFSARLMACNLKKVRNN